ncbi:unnamed protein product, partial [Mesorhabditis belari]
TSNGENDKKELKQPSRRSSTKRNSPFSDAIVKEVVRVMMIDDRRQKEALQAKGDAAGQDTTIADMLMWKHEIEGINQRAEYLKKQWGEYMVNDPKHYEMIDWEKIATLGKSSGTVDQHKPLAKR